MKLRRHRRADRFRGCLLGLAVGDAVGTTVEFSRPGSFEPVTDMVGGGPFDLPAGYWTDDTSMALCLAESLVELGEFNPADQLVRYTRWWREGHWSSTGVCFDIGNATQAALARWEAHGDPWPGDHAPTAAGNGPLMKLAPIPMAWADQVETAMRNAARSARTTHGAPEALDGARHFARLLVEALGGASKDKVLRRRETPELHHAIAAVAAGSFLDAAPPQIRGAGYVVLSLEAALWAVASTESFEAAILAAVNLGDDADTTAAIAGQLAGALYGLEGIPAHWVERVHRRDEILAFADKLNVLDV